MAIIKNVNLEATVLKFFDYKAAACVVKPSTTGTQNIDNRTILKAGTPFPANDATCLGYLLHDYDVTDGDVEAAYVYEGVIDPAKLTANNITVADAAKTATPKVTFYGTVYSA